MADPFGFLKHARKENPYRKVDERIKDWRELQIPLSVEERQEQASRCMNCGIPFCHTGTFYGGKRAVSGCPNDNLIPEWNDLVYQGRFKAAFERLARTNPLPEMTGRVCPAPCEKACTESLNGSGVTIHDNERFIIDTAFENGWVKESGQPAQRTGFKVAIVGSGPAGLSAAWRLNQLGHEVTVFERSDRFGGLLMYGIPNMKLDKEIVQRRIDLMAELGIHFVANTEIGRDITAEELQRDFDRVIIAAGASVPRDLKVPGRELNGVKFAVDYLTEATKDVLKHGKEATSRKLEGKHVIVIGGGDTGNDCISSAIRQGAASVKQLEITPQLPLERQSDNPWPEYPMINRVGYGQEEALTVFEKEQLTYYSTSTTGFIGAERGQLIGIETVKVDQKFQPIPGTEQVMKADLVLLAMGFLGAENSLLESFGVKEVYDDSTTNNERVLVAGDAKRGPSLVIWGIREGRLAAEKVDQALRALTYQA
ncbi:glutamate synthase subunit beta [Enterococcus cecorum]|uniref:glutamate synthase subunit beta n=1 Tax=Enterococcus cecorum TaxID=44008 RepID=UPI002ACA9240|nr:glutamate synthase subunit beta [Enterococcus cecorum]MDZ5439078.1 glutamate synthase subunit beta [Enterococcus cecorum]MDZ5497132.1 glutamate synthase subunit beta [Enterococcus cecorum]MDZ5499266.1 glutamate synthase subunit beta [Enterococcus cecorum]MDZ5561625.1 glutamate synthase subunit beta [Enterococcus cecorum]MDZ5588520.1 glutamate synthase subunit beta [Enterococcus cecorum]